MDRWQMDRPYFTGPLWLPLSVKKSTQNTHTNIHSFFTHKKKERIHQQRLFKKQQGKLKEKNAAFEGGNVVLTNR